MSLRVANIDNPTAVPQAGVERSAAQEQQPHELTGGEACASKARKRAVMVASALAVLAAERVGS
jgi:hypothetical protein